VVSAPSTARDWRSRIEDSQVRESGPGAPKIFTGKTGDVGGGVFVGKKILANVGGMNFKGEASLGEKFTTAGRG
jgi:hypothetical protein